MRGSYIAREVAVELTVSRLCVIMLKRGVKLLRGVSDAARSTVHVFLPPEVCGCFVSRALAPVSYACVSG